MYECPSSKTNSKQFTYFFKIGHNMIPISKRKGTLSLSNHWTQTHINWIFNPIEKPIISSIEFTLYFIHDLILAAKPITCIYMQVECFKLGRICIVSA